MTKPVHKYTLVLPFGTLNVEYQLTPGQPNGDHASIDVLSVSYTTDPRAMATTLYARHMEIAVRDNVSEDVSMHCQDLVRYNDIVSEPSTIEPVSNLHDAARRIWELLDKLANRSEPPMSAPPVTHREAEEPGDVLDGAYKVSHGNKHEYPETFNSEEEPEFDSAGYSAADNDEQFPEEPPYDPDPSQYQYDPS